MNSKLAIGSPCLQPLPMLIVFEVFPAFINMTVKSFSMIIIQSMRLSLNLKNWSTAFMKAKAIESKALKKSTANIIPVSELRLASQMMSYSLLIAFVIFLHL